jgi:hypothetical protein
VLLRPEPHEACERLAEFYDARFQIVPKFAHLPNEFPVLGPVPLEPREPVDSHETFFRLKVALEAQNQARQAYFEFGTRGSSLYCSGELVFLGDQLPMFAIYLTQGL